MKRIALAVLCVFLLRWSPLFAEGFVHNAISVATSSTAVYAASYSRYFLLLENISDTDISCNLAGDAAVVGQGVVLKKDGGYLLLDVRAAMPLAAIACIHGGSGTKALAATQID